MATDATVKCYKQQQAVNRLTSCPGGIHIHR